MKNFVLRDLIPQYQMDGVAGSLINIDLAVREYAQASLYIDQQKTLFFKSDSLGMAFQADVRKRRP